MKLVPVSVIMLMILIVTKAETNYKADRAFNSLTESSSGWCERHYELRDCHVIAADCRWPAVRSMLVHPKDKALTLNKCGIVYKIPCTGCDQFYIGETCRPIGTRVKEHRSSRDNPTAVAEHCAQGHHDIDDNSISVTAREDNWWRRKIRESIEIRTQRPPNEPRRRVRTAGLLQPAAIT
jgi:hypothetical protein